MQPSEQAGVGRDPSNWPVKVYRLGDEPGDNLAAETTADERLEMMWVLRDRMWELTGRPLPGHARRDTPIRIVRR